MSKKWLKQILILVALFGVYLFAPTNPIDPWNLFSLKKLVLMIFALSFIQTMGSLAIQLLGSRTGSILTGFFGGLISSTATIATLAQKSKIKTSEDLAPEVLIFLSATLAMLCEGATLLVMGLQEFHLALFIVFLGPLLITIVLIFLQSNKHRNESSKIENTDFSILPILKLSAFIIFVLTLSKILQNYFGQNGIFILTFIVSLFEIHGSIIANIQLHDNGAFDIKILGSLLAISIAASYASKVFLLSMISQKKLRNKIIKLTGILFITLIVSLLLFILATASY